MNLTETINTDFKAAYLAKDMIKKNFLGLLKGEIQLESSKEGFNGDESVLKIITKMKKSLTTTGDVDSLRELTYLEDYLPKQIDRHDLVNVIDSYVREEGLSTIKDMGRVMSHLKTNFSGQYDGKMASNIIKEILI